MFDLPTPIWPDNTTLNNNNWNEKYLHFAGTYFYSKVGLN